MKNGDIIVYKAPLKTLNYKVVERLCKVVAIWNPGHLISSWEAKKYYSNLRFDGRVIKSKTFVLKVVGKFKKGNYIIVPEKARFVKITVL